MSQIIFNDIISLFLYLPLANISNIVKYLNVKPGADFIKKFRWKFTHCFGKLGYKSAMGKIVYNNEMV